MILFLMNFARLLILLFILRRLRCMRRSCNWSDGSYRASAILLLISFGIPDWLSNYYAFSFRCN